MFRRQYSDDSARLNFNCPRSLKYCTTNNLITVSIQPQPTLSNSIITTADVTTIQEDSCSSAASTSTLNQKRIKLF